MTATLLPLRRPTPPSIDQRGARTRHEPQLSQLPNLSGSGEAPSPSRNLRNLASAACAILLLSIAFLAPTVTAAAPRLVIIDDDVIGMNGAPALLLQAPDVRVLGITTTSGSVWRDTATAHALRTVEIVDARVPVIPGAVYPLINNEARTRAWEGLHGRLIYKGPWTGDWAEDTLQSKPPSHPPEVVPDLREGNPTTRPSAEIAAAWLVRMAREHPHEITLIATGPMTNIAIAQSLDPSFAANIRELVYMGGSLAPRQRLATRSAAEFAREFVNTPRREFNIRWDPEAARIVAHAPFAKVTMVPVDPSTGTEWTAEFIAALPKTPLTAALARSIEAGFPMWDELAAMVWLHPEIVTEQERLYIDFETDGGASYGDTLSWTAAYRPKLGEREQTVIRSVDRAMLEAAMRALYARRP
ncbi:nucleoside hydrolase [Sphingomonas sp. ID0503]|uniref:nucleoside hydrolase n=1 Tax=Sphingomonas sp. ID0503 TaxID=3399691 RepID=UPI003AFB3FB2